MARHMEAGLPLGWCCRLVLPYYDVKHVTNGTDPCDPPRIGAKSTTTSNHPITLVVIHLLLIRVHWIFSNASDLYLKMAWCFIIKLYSETQVSDRLGMSGGRSPRHAQNPLSGERRKTLSITHHALSPPPSHHHLYIIHLINWLQRFYRITMSLKRPFVPKSDVKQWFTTTLSGGRSPRHAQNPLSGDRRKTLSITHYALSPLPSHLINWDNVFIILQCHLKDLLYLKVTWSNDLLLLLLLHVFSSCIHC